MKKFNVLQAIILLAAAFAAGYLIWWVMPGYLQQSHGARSVESLRQEAEQMNKGLPAMLDKETELMVTEAEPGMFIYKYRLVNVSAPAVDHQNFAAGAKPQLVQMVCGRPETRDDFLGRGVTMRYSYFDKDKRHIATIDVTPSDCGL